MLRRLLKLLPVASLVLGVLTLAVWLISFYWNARVIRGNPAGPEGGHAISLHRGWFQLELNHNWSSPDFWPEVTGWSMPGFSYEYRVATEVAQESIDLNWRLNTTSGFWVDIVPWTGPKATSEVYRFNLWLLMPLSLPALFLYFDYQKLQRKRLLAFAARPPAIKCPVCGYDLRASPDLCPECGARSMNRAPRAKS